LWIAWALLEAGRLWQTPQYTEVGKALLARIADEEVTAVPGWGRWCCREKSALPMIAAGVLTPAFRRSWPPTSAALAPLAETARQQPASAAGDRAERFFA
jgi:hypothetical protein